MCIFHKWTKWQAYKKPYLWTPGILSPKEIKDYCEIIAELEGDNKKKVKAGKQSEEKSPKV